MSTGNRRTAHVRSKGFSRVLVLSKKDLHESLAEYPDAKKMLREKANSLLKQDLQRQVSAELRWNSASVEADDKLTQGEEGPDFQLSGVKTDNKGTHIKDKQNAVPLPRASMIIIPEEDGVEETCEESSKTMLIEEAAGQQEISEEPEVIVIHKTPNPVDTDLTTSDSQPAIQSYSNRDSAPHDQNDLTAAAADNSSETKIEIERVELISNGLYDICSAIELPKVAEDVGVVDSSADLMDRWITKKAHLRLEREPSNTELYKTGTELDIFSLSGSGTTVGGTVSEQLDQECPSWIVLNKAKVGLLIACNLTFAGVFIYVRSIPASLCA